MSEMAEYINDNPKAVAPGEPIMIDNQCGSPVEVSAGLVFRKDGDYIVSVRGGKITVRVNGEPAVRRGRWERKPDPYGFFETIPVCSVCGCTTKWREEYLYCPHCGAKMYGEADDGE